MERANRIAQCKPHFEANKALTELHVTEDGTVFESVNYANAHGKRQGFKSNALAVTRADVDALKLEEAEAAKAKAEAAAKAKADADAKKADAAAKKAADEAAKKQENPA